MSTFLSEMTGHPFMVRTGWMLVHSLWQGALLALVTWSLLRVLRTPAARAAVAFASMAAMAICLPVTWICLRPDHTTRGGVSAPFIEWESVFAAGSMERSPEELPVVPAAAPLSVPEASPTAPGAAMPQPAPAAPAETAWMGWTACAWLTGVLLLGLLRAGGWLQMWRWRTRGVEPASGELRDCLRAAADKTGVRRPCRIRLSRLVRSPMLCGCWRPVILFPLSLLTKLDRQQIEALLIHELTHLRRRDFLLNSLQLVFETVLFYHPAVWWAGRQLRECREHACDDAAVRAGAEPLAYAKTLACLGAQWNASAVSARGGSLLARVRRLLTGREAPIPVPALTGILPLLAAFLYLGSGPEAQTEAAEPEAKEETPSKADEAARFRYRWQRWGDRGSITDRHGVTLAGNEERWALLIEPRAVGEDYQRLTGKGPLQRPSEKPDKPPVDDVPAMLTELFAASVMPELKELATSDSPLSERYKRWLRRFHAEVNPWPVLAPVTFAKDQSERLAAAVKDWRCARLASSTQRNYPLGARAAHMLGLVGMDMEARGRLKDPAFTASPEGRHALGEGSLVGKSGVEKLMEADLMGKEWYQNGHFDDARGIVFDDEAPNLMSGRNVRLTLDAGMQAISEETLRAAGAGCGAAVLLDVRNGDILAAASVPSYDPGIFVRQDVKAIEEFYGDQTEPFLARAVRDQSPGSTFKLVTALAGARAGKAARSYHCAGSVNYGRPMACWIARQDGGSHGVLDLPSAIKCSCNCYFFQLGNDVGAERLAEMATFFGIGQRAGPFESLDIEQFGSIATPSSEKAQGRTWSPSMTANISIGQGMLAATPLQMANVAAAIANGGRIYAPRLVLDSHPGSTDLSHAAVPEAGELSTNLLEQGVTPQALETIRRGMWDVVNAPGGTGMSARSAIGIAGKSGTAQRNRNDGNGGVFPNNSAWFLAFAPYEAPRYAVAVLVENGESGGKTCAPIARRILEQVLKADKAAPVPLRGDPIKGHLNKVDMVVFPDEAQ